MKIIARIHNGFSTKFGIPRQSGLVEELKSSIIFEPEYRNPDAVRGLEQFSHIWLIWEFSENIRDTWSSTVRPPRLGGNKRVGVFASRSPFRPNPIGLSCVRLEHLEITGERGPVLHVSGADLMNGTPILDIKPYLPFSDSHPEAAGGYADRMKDKALEIDFPVQWREMIPEEQQAALIAVLKEDPRPSYHQDPHRVYGFFFEDYEIKFTVKNRTLTVCRILPRKYGNNDGNESSSDIE